MSKNQKWTRKTQFTMNISVRIPNSLYARLEQHQASTGRSKTEIFNAALDEYLPHYSYLLEEQQEGGSKE